MGAYRKYQVDLLSQLIIQVCTCFQTKPKGSKYKFSRFLALVSILGMVTIPCIDTRARNLENLYLDALGLVWKQSQTWMVFGETSSIGYLDPLEKSSLGLGDDSGMTGWPGSPASMASAMYLEMQPFCSST